MNELAEFCTGDGDNLFKSCLSGETFIPTILTHRHVSVFIGLLKQLAVVFALDDEILHFLSEENDFVNGESTAKASIPATITAHSIVTLAGDVVRYFHLLPLVRGEIVRSFTVRAQAAHKTLR